MFIGEAIQQTISCLTIERFITFMHCQYVALCFERKWNGSPIYAHPSENEFWAPHPTRAHSQQQLPEWPSQVHWRQKQTLRHLKQNAQSSVRKNVGSLAFSTSKRFGRLQKRIRITRCGGGGVSQPIYSPITVRSQSDLQSDHSPITVRSYVLIAFRFNHSKKKLKI